MVAHSVSLRVRRTVAFVVIAVSAILLLAAGSERADAKAKGHAKVTKGPKGLKFYNPPRKLPKQHGTLIWARKAQGLVPLADAKSTRLVLYSSRTPRGSKTAVSGSVSVPRGKPPKGGWPMISWAHGTTGVAERLRAFAEQPRLARSGLDLLHLPRPQRVAPGRLRGGADRLSGPRHSGQTSVPGW